MSAFAVVSLPSLERADSLLESLQSSNLEPTALELVASDRLSAGPRSEAAVTLWIGFESTEIEVRWMLDAAKGTLQERGRGVRFD